MLLCARSEEKYTDADILNELNRCKYLYCHTFFTMLQFWKSLEKQAIDYYAEENKLLVRLTGNQGDDFEPDETLEKVLSVLGKKHQNGLSLIPELGIKFNIQENLNVAVPKRANISLPTKRIKNNKETDDAFLRSEILSLLEGINENFRNALQ